MLPNPLQGSGDQFGPVLGPVLRLQALGKAHPLLPFPLLEPLLEVAPPGMSRLCRFMAGSGNREDT